MKKILSLVILSQVLFSCKNDTTDSPKTVIEETNSIITTTTPKVSVNLELKNCELNEAYFNSKTKTPKTLKNSEIIDLNLNIIKDLTDDQSTKIKVIDTLFISKLEKIIIVSKETENENTAYLVQLDIKNKAFSYEMVYYTDFVEYYSTTSTKVSSNKVEINTETDTGEGNPTKELISLKFSDGKLESSH